MEVHLASHISFIFSPVAISALARLFKMQSILGIPAAADDSVFMDGCDELELKGYLRYAGDQPLVSETIGLLMILLAKPDALFVIKNNNVLIQGHALPGVFCLIHMLPGGVLSIMPLESSRDVVMDIDQTHRPLLLREPIKYSFSQGKELKLVDVDYDSMIDHLASNLSGYDEVQ